MSKPEARWRGWDYGKINGLAVCVSKKHLFINRQPVCGVYVSSMILLGKDRGHGKCKKCQKWEAKNKDNYNII